MKSLFEKKKKIVIKIGSSLLVSEGKLREKWLNNFAKNISDLVVRDFDIVIVTSGSVALGRSIISAASLPEKQAAAAVGQIQLMSSCRNLFAKHGMHVAQILLSSADCDIRTRYLNSRNTIKTLIKNKVIPIINENDTVVVEEIKIGDNDRLAARVAQMISADLLILFSDIDGLYDKNPREHKDAKLISEVRSITRAVEKMAGDAGSNVGTGGMATKIVAAKMLFNSKCQTVITSGIEENSLKRLTEGKQIFTIFCSRGRSTKSRKNWLSGFVNAKGEIIVNARAAEVLRKNKSSLLPVGVVEISGDFRKGEAVFIHDEKGNHIASGTTNYTASETKKIIGKKSSEMKKILGKTTKSELVHINNLVIV